VSPARGTTMEEALEDPGYISEFMELAFLGFWHCLSYETDWLSIRMDFLRSRQWLHGSREFRNTHRGNIHMYTRVFSIFPKSEISGRTSQAFMGLRKGCVVISLGFCQSTVLTKVYHILSRLLRIHSNPLCRNRGTPSWCVSKLGPRLLWLV
jgi:hypothetical protein